ncbi:uncharacterized protein LOC121407037 isoform X1 [Lytechinus variegatus]|uniref:uncharacterized protein LOC121407037 isoform X1 n=1 Tax=Lytechinus variegatus TaxID=7654 RepID=UPI001BB19DE3|nr:uncharacterized protein LOC121407037 isoform X1 [Lytechinus variegatus]
MSPLTDCRRIILLFTIVFSPGVWGTELEEKRVNVDTSKALYFRETRDLSAQNRVHRVGQGTIIGVVYERTSSSSSASFGNVGGEERRLRRESDDAGRHRSRRSTDFSSMDEDAIVAKHNEGRSMVSPEAANMKTMVWNIALASMAQEWSDGCYYEHGNPENDSGFSAVGQNLYIKWGLSAPGTPPDGTAATQAWYNEYQFYNYDDGTCQAGEQCGHYTQNVWASTYAVGCGLTFCSTATDASGNAYNGAWLITCNYGPAGNYVGASPYVSGPPCTKCESGSGLCKDNLCSDCSPSEAECECRATCDNCGTLNSDCTCTCADGWHGSDCATYCEDTHEYCGASPGWPLSWCDRSYVMDGCPAFCSLCNAEDPDFVCIETTTSTTNVAVTSCSLSNCLHDSAFDEEMCRCNCTGSYYGNICQHAASRRNNGVLILLFEDFEDWNSIQGSVMGALRTSVINYCSTRQSTCCPAANNTNIDFASTGVTLDDEYPKITLDYSSAAYWILVTGISPVAPGLCRQNDGGLLSADVVLAAIRQDETSLESSLGVNIETMKESSATHLVFSQTLIMLNMLLAYVLCLGF